MAHLDYENLDQKPLSDKEQEVIYIMRNADKFWVPFFEIVRDSSMGRRKCSKVLERLRRREIVVKREMEKGMPGQIEYSFKEPIRASNS